MGVVKRFFKRNSHNAFFKVLAGFGRSLNRFYENRNHDTHSNGEWVVLKKLAKINPSMIIDGGANVGTYSLLANECNPQAKIYSFEPVRDTYQKLKQSTEGIENIIPIEKGLFKDNCNKEINIFSSNEHASLVDIKGLSYESSEKQNIALVKGDDFLRDHQIEEVDLLKVDLEGADYDAILGFDDYITRGKIKMIQFEFGYINITTKVLLMDFYQYFESKGYLVGKIFPKLVEFRKYEFRHEDFIGPNFIAVHKEETELINLLKKK